MSIPEKTGYTKDQINKQIAKATTKEEVKEIISRKIELQNIEIQIRIYKGNGKFAWWVLNKKGKKDKEGDWIFTQSKNTETTSIYSTDELKNIFKDTIAILDTLRLNLFLQDENFNTDQYYIIAKCNNSLFTEPLAYNQNSIMLYEPIQLPCTNEFVHINLHNRLNPEIFLGECDVYFISERIKNTLKDLAISLKEVDRAISFKDIVNYISGYVEQNYGKVSRYEITRLLINVPDLKM